jgi:SnoaL-like domain
MTDDSDAILKLMNRYAELFDSGRLEEFASLFDRGTLTFEGMGSFTGPAAVLGFIDRMVMLYKGKPRTSHLMNNVSIDIEPDGEDATASSYVTVLQALPDFPLQPIVVGRYTDRFKRHEGQWCFAERTANRHLPGDISHHLRLGQSA